MKKYLYSILAVVAVLSACAKVDQVEKTVEPKDAEKASFYGTIEQPEGLTRTYIFEENDAAVSINWSAGDVISVYGKATGIKNFVADQDGAYVYFGSSDPDAGVFLKDNDGAGYDAYYPVWAKNEYWFDGGQINLSCKSSYTDKNGNNINQASLEYMPMYASIVGPVSNPSHTYRQLRFSCAYHAILKLTIPESFACSKMEVIDSGKEPALAVIDNINELGAVNGVKTIYVPIPADPKSEKKYSELTFNAYNGSTSVATMFTFKGEDKTLGTIDGITVENNTIYAFDYCNTLTIDKDDTYELKCNTLDYKINVVGNRESLTIIANGGNAPANITINARGYKVNSLTINAPNSHVELINGESANVVSNTSKTTLVVNPTYKITSVTVNEGSVAIKGTEDHAGNVTQVIIPEEAVGKINVVISKLTSDPVKITTFKPAAEVVVVGVKAEEYTVDETQGTKDVTEVKEAVAKIGEVEYYTLDDAFAAAKNGETVKLAAANTVTACVELENKEITLDLNGQTVTYTGSELLPTGIIRVHNGAGLIINDSDSNKGGKIVSGENPYAYAAVALTKKGDNSSSPAKLIVNGGTLEGHFYGITGNGNRPNTEITINGGTIKGTAQNDNVGIFHPQSGTLTINGGTIEGSTGIALKGGMLVVNDGKIVGNGEKKDFSHNGSGWNNTGDALAVEVCDYPGQPLTVEVKGGEFSSGNGEAVASYAQPGKDYTPLKGFISGGLFSTKPSDNLIASGYVAEKNANDMWAIVEGGNYVAKIGNTPYETLAEAITAAKAGDVVSIVKADTYKIPSIKADITVEGAVGNVVFDCVGSGNIVEIPNGPTFKNVIMEFGQSGYHGFQHAGHITMDECTLNGLFHSYGVMTFNKCTFNQTKEEYNMWVYAGNVTYSDCTFNSVGKFLNVYNEGNDKGTPWEVVATNCVFNTTKANKAALNIKETCGATALKYNVTITNCTCNEKQKELSNVNDGTLYRVSPIWQVDDRNDGSTGINVTVDGQKVYPFCSKDADGNYHIVNADGLIQFHDLYAAEKVASTAKVFLENDIDFTGKTWTALEWHADNAFKGFALFDGQNHTIKNFTVSGQGMFSRWACTSKIGATPHFKDIVFDGAKNVTSTLNVSLFCGQVYQDALIENVTIKNSQFEGTYKVAPFVGTVFDEKPANTVTLTMKDCKVENTTVRSTKYNYCTCGMVAWVSDIDDQDKIVFEGNNVVKDVTLYKSNVSYNLFGKIYWGDGDKDGVAHDEATNVTVTNVNIVNAQ